MSGGRSRSLRALSWVLLGIAVAIAVGGLVYDGVREGEDPDLSSLYAVGAVLAFVAMGLGYWARADEKGRRRS